MSEELKTTPATGWTKLYHTSGAQVSLPVIGDTPAAMFANVTAMMAAGFLTAAPGLEVGEERETVSHVVRSVFERDGEETAIILLYAANEAMKWSVLKLYLNNDDEVHSFEKACGVKLDSLPLYEGKDKPERDGGKLAQRVITKLPHNVNIVFKQNPKWSEEEAAAHKSANKMYPKPRRIFVRWGDVAAPVETSQASAVVAQASTAAAQASAAVAQPAAQPAKPTEDPLIAEWRKKLNPDTVNTYILNNTLLAEFKLIPKSDPRRPDIWNLILDFTQLPAVASFGLRFDKDRKCFIEDVPI